MSASNIQVSRKEKLMAMPSDELEKFIELLHVQSSSDNEKRMVIYLYEQLKEMNLNMEIDAEGNILVVKGETNIYPCIVAHMDTVHDIREDYHIKTTTKQKRQIAYAVSNNKQVGTGGDDKCGIYSVLFMLRRLPAMKAVFFSREEIGLIGSSGVDHDWFSDVGYIIQLDRWGRGDLICKYHGSKTVSDNFLTNVKSSMKKFGYKETEGLITDSIGLWKDDIGVSCINVSCGYYQHHTSNETIDLNEFWNSIMFAYDMVMNLGCKMYKSNPVFVYTYKNRYSYDDFDYVTNLYRNTSMNKWAKKDKEIELNIPKELNGQDAINDYAFYIQELELDYGVADLRKLPDIDIEDCREYVNICLNDDGESSLSWDEFRHLLDVFYTEIESYYDDTNDIPF